MSINDCCSTDDCECGSECECGCDVKVNVDVSKIIKYLSVAGVLIVGIIFGTRTFRKMMDEGFFDIVE